MKPNFRTCPQCSTRNRLDKEFCVKCGEPLEGIKAGDPTATAKKGKPGIFISEDGEKEQSPLVPLVLVLLTLGVAFAAWRTIQDAQAQTPVAVVSTAPRVQPSVPASVANAPSPGATDYASGVTALRAGDFSTAVRFLRLATAAANRADYRLALAEALEKSGATSEGLAEYEAAAGLDTNPRFRSEWAKALNRAGRYPEAVRAYESALQLEPENLANLRELSNLQMKNNDLVKARPYLERIVQLQPDDQTPKQNLGRALEASGDLEGAATQYRQVLTALPDATLTRALLSDVLMKQNQPDQALQLLAEGLSQNPNAAVLHRERGRILDRQGKNAEAVAAYREYVRLAPGATDLRIFTARIDQLSAFMAQQQ